MNLTPVRWWSWLIVAGVLLAVMWLLEASPQ